MFSSITGQLAQADLCSVVLQDGGLGWLVFSITGRLAQAGLCLVVL